MMRRGRRLTMPRGASDRIVGRSRMLGLLEAEALDVGWEAWERFRIEDIEN